ncbi:Uncharacterized protein BM_BM8020 [Brugia malayi]|uniref:BMA-PSF-3, isoform b n=1 Tax=Brugia malayi TaxID=6279 RepID=A0A0J9XLS4_BRUMA|nr:Uncharacterized protein BM_BM8020 [Brugia malayi]CDP90948.1 BMA-PSF-3, isoform b [Brugia malayi]VIO95640.1 Uncharacterized protein BM_BM8020 [Brugia malayi]
MERTQSALMDVDKNYYDIRDILACKQSLKCLFSSPLPRGCTSNRIQSSTNASFACSTRACRCDAFESVLLHPFETYCQINSR